jgi:stress response protein SCP2
MKTFLKHLLVFVFIVGIYSISSCRKNVTEPKESTSKQEFIFIEIDSNQFLIDQKKWNLNKNSWGAIGDEYTEVGLKIHYNVSFENTKLKVGICKGDIHLSFTNQTGIQLPEYIRLNLKLDTDDQRPMYQIYADYDSTNSVNQFKNLNFTLKNFDSETHHVEYELEGDVMSIQDSLYHKLKIHSKTIFN